MYQRRGTGKFLMLLTVSFAVMWAVHHTKRPVSWLWKSKFLGARCLYKFVGEDRGCLLVELALNFMHISQVSQ